MPDFKFNCYGNIINWSALVAYRQKGGYNYRVSFEVWRPTCNGGYRLVGFDVININDGGITDPIPVPDDALDHLYTILEDNESMDNFGDGEALYFQPNDILGFSFIKNTGSFRPFYITYQQETEGDLVNMHVRETNCGSEDDCPTSESLEDRFIIPSVIPNIHFNYGMLLKI